MSQGFTSQLPVPLPTAQGGTGVTNTNWTAASLTFSPTTQGIVGTTTNDSAGAGYVGEIISSNVAPGTVALTSGVITNITSITLTAGDWDVWGNVGFSSGTGSTTISSLVASISNTSASLETYPVGGAVQQLSLPFATGSNPFVSAGFRRYSLSSTTTIYLIGVASFAVSTLAGSGFIGARRAR